MDRHPDRKIRAGKAVDGQRIRQANNNTIGTNQIDVTREETFYKFLEIKQPI